MCHFLFSFLRARGAQGLLLKKVCKIFGDFKKCLGFLEKKNWSFRKARQRCTFVLL